MTIKKTTSLLLVILLTLPFWGQSQSLNDDPRIKSAINLLELWLDAQRDYEQLPGISLAIIHDQELVWSGGFGYSDLEKKSPAISSTIYSICSLSKLFTSIAIMQLRDNGLLRLDDPVEEHLSYFKIMQNPDETPITIQNLLTHSSGLPRDLDATYWCCDYEFPTQEEIIENISNLTPQHSVNTYFNYSNIGMAILGQVIEKLSKKDYSEYITENIIIPLGLTDTQPKMPEDSKKSRLATGYSSLTRKHVRDKLSFFQGNGLTPAMGFSSTVEDLAKFASWQFRLLTNGGSEVLSANTLHEMHRIHWINKDLQTYWGLGFNAFRNYGKTFVGHSGGCPGYRTHLLIDTEDKFAAVCMINACGVTQELYTLRAYNIFAPVIKEALSSPYNEEQDNAELHKYVGTYDSQPWMGESAVLIWKGKLAILSLPTEYPLSGMKELKHIEGNKFRRIRDDGELAEEVIFETDSDGKVISMRSQGDRSQKIR